MIVATLNRVSFVEWDRLVRGPAANDPEAWYVTVYGWIGRDDGRSDFVLIEFSSWAPEPYFLTSSAARSHDIAAAIYGTQEGHAGDCERVEVVFPDVVRKAEL
jgi:hypothetical protein